MFFLIYCISCLYNHLITKLTYLSISKLIKAYFLLFVFEKESIKIIIMNQS
jgi:hypothetical protein